MFSLGIITVFVLLGAAAFSISQVSAPIRMNSIRRSCDYLVDRSAFPWRDPHRIFEPSISGAGRGYKQHVRDGILCCWACLCCGMDACVGGVLTAVVMTASFEDTAYQGIGLLFVFGLGLTLPFIVAAFFIKPFLRFAGKFRRYLGAVEKLMGLLMVGFAILLITNSINGIANWMIETFPVFLNI